jgi:hypothetical protein
MVWEEIIKVSLGPMIGLLGVAYALMRNHHYGELARLKKENDERKSIAAGLYAELSAIKFLYMSHLIALQVKSESYVQLAEQEATKNNPTCQSLTQFIPDFEITIYSSNASKIGMLGEVVSAKVVSCYTLLSLPEKLLAKRVITTNSELGSAAKYASQLLQNNMRSIDSALSVLSSIAETNYKEELNKLSYKALEANA